jgi:hypothetical protein
MNPTALPVPASSAASTSSPPSPEKTSGWRSKKSAQTRRAYRLDVQHFMRAFGITSTDMLRQVDHRVGPDAARAGRRGGPVIGGDVRTQQEANCGFDPTGVTDTELREVWMLGASAVVLKPSQGHSGRRA